MRIDFPVEYFADSEGRSLVLEWEEGRWFMSVETSSDRRALIGDDCWIAVRLLLGDPTDYLDRQRAAGVPDLEARRLVHDIVLATLRSELSRYWCRAALKWLDHLGEAGPELLVALLRFDRAGIHNRHSAREVNAAIKSVAGRGESTTLNRVIERARDVMRLEPDPDWFNAVIELYRGCRRELGSDDQEVLLDFFARHLEACYGAHPRVLDLEDYEGWVRDELSPNRRLAEIAMADRPRWLRLLRSFHIEGFVKLVQYKLPLFMASPLLSRLEALSLVGHGLTDEVFEQVFSNTRFSLRALALGGGKLTDKSVDTLSRSPHCDSLEALSLSGNAIFERGASMEIFEVFPRLRALNIVANSGLPEAMEQVFLSGAGPALEVLALGYQGIGPDGTGVLADCAWLGGLKALHLPKSQIGDEGLALLADSPHLEALTHLNLDWSNLTRRSTELLMNERLFPGLRWVDVGGNEIAGEVVEALRRARPGVEVVW